MFNKIKALSNIVPKLMQLAYKADEWTPYYSFSALAVPDEIIDKDPFLVALSKKRKFRAGILKMDPNTCYNWHMDTDRSVAINLLLCDDGNSKCVFAPNGFGIVNPIVELKYEPFTYYAFNTKCYHTVFNFSEPRYLFSLEFLEEDRGLTYDELCADLKGLNYVD